MGLVALCAVGLAAARAESAAGGMFLLALLLYGMLLTVRSIV